MATQAGAQSLAASGSGTAGGDLHADSLAPGQETTASIATAVPDGSPPEPVEISNGDASADAATADAAHDAPEQSVTAAVTAWSKAWSQGDVPAYLDCYSTDFSPGKGVTHKQWQQQRRARIKGSGRIAIQVGTVNVEVFGPDIAQASFQQTYRSEVYRDQAIKVLDLIMVDGKWKISGETGLADKFQ